MNTIQRLAAAALALCGALALATPGPVARAADESPEPVELTALTGPQGGTLAIEVPAGVQALEHVHVQMIAPEGATPAQAANQILNVKDVGVVDGVATVELGPLARGTAVSADVHVREETPPRTVIRRGKATARLRPDLVVTAVDVPAQTLTTRAVNVVADVEELNGETGAKAMLTLMLGPTPLAEPQSVTIPAGGSRSVTFAGVKLETAMSAELTVTLADAAPYETDATNNSRAQTVEVTEHELLRSTVLVPYLGGYGAQFNQHVYAPITPWPPGTGYGDHEDKARALQPHLVRIFYNDNWDGNWNGQFPDWQLNYASFVQVVRLAQEAGATIDISFQSLANAKNAPVPAMAKFADVLEDLVRNHGLENVRWAEVGNEPNSGTVTLAEYNTLVRELDAQLVARGLREEINLMGGGLVENAGNAARNHYVWMEWIAANMSDVFDAWAEHVYWNYNDAGRLEYRLRDSWNLLNTVLPPEQRKPTYMMEFGARGISTCGTKPTAANTWYAADPACPEIYRTNIAAFQQFWFAIGSAQLGYTGAAKWDAYWGVYDRTRNPPQVYWTIGPPTEGSPLLPSYHALSLLFHTTVPGWQVVGIDPWDESDWSVETYGVEGHSSNDTPEKELAAYAGPSGELTILGLDTNGRALNGVSSDSPAQYSIGGLTAHTQFNLALWNATGNGENSLAGLVTADAAGVVRFEVPLHAAFALTTVPVS